MITKTFNEFRIGQTFKSQTGVVYEKTDVRKSKPIKDSRGGAITDGSETEGFFNTKLLMEEIQ